MKKWKSTPVSLAVALAFAMAVAAVPASAQIDNVCVIGFSKDFGALRVNSGDWNQISCLVPDVASCRTLSGRDANAGGFFFSDGATCHNGPCDEAFDLDGRFEAVVDIGIRLQDACPVRGSWEGSFRLLDALTQTVVLASGTIDGTLGVGTHREETNDCEGCSVARFDSQLSRWFFHSEGFIDGKVVSGIHAGCRMRISYQGEFNANGDAGGPQPPNYNWGFEGKADGVLLCPCE